MGEPEGDIRRRSPAALPGVGPDGHVPRAGANSFDRSWSRPYNGPMQGNRTDTMLFEAQEKANLNAAAPLASRMRPRTLEEFVGQRHFLGPGKLLTRMLQADRLSSVLFCGPPGVGKTSLAMVIASKTKAKFHYLSAPPPR